MLHSVFVIIFVSNFIREQTELGTTRIEINPEQEGY